MNITSVRYGFTKNLGNYESARLDVEADVSPQDDPLEIFAQVKRWVEDRLEIPQQETQETQETQNEYASDF